LAVGVVEEGGGGAEGDSAYFVEFEGGGVGFAVEGLDVEAVFEVGDEAADGAGGVLEGVFFAELEGFIAHPDDHGFEILADLGLVVGAGEHVAAADVDVVLEGEGDGHGGVALFEGFFVAVDGFYL